MHIPDGFLNVPTAAATATLAAGGIGLAVRRLRSFDVESRVAPLLGVTAAGVFAAQMINFPVLHGTSGHLLGGVLAGVLLGPWAGTLAVAVVLGVQCLAFGDGGVLALGANVFNLAILGSMVGYFLYASMRRALPASPRGIAVASAIAAWFSVALASIACSIELSASGTYALAPTLFAMVGVHAAIGVGEAIITGLAVRFVLRTRPDLLYEESERTHVAARSAQVVIAGLAIAVVIATLLSPFASPWPDGLERVAEKLGFIHAATEPLLAGAMPDYKMTWLPESGFSTSIAGLVGTLLVFGLGYFALRLARAGADVENPTHAPGNL